MRSDLTDDDRRFAARLETCRLMARLSRLKLASAATLSEATIKFIEKGWTKPSVRTIHSLLQVSSLGLAIEDVPATLREAVERMLSLSHESATTVASREHLSAIGCSDGIGKRQRRFTKSGQKDTNKHTEDTAR